MFRGNATVNLDEKNRFAVPARFRDRVLEVCGTKLVVTVAVNERCVAMDDCIWLYPLTAWEQLEAEVKSLPAFKKKAIRLRQVLIGSAFDCEMDSQGRILLPEKIRKMANLDRKLVLVGQLNRMELWNEEVWAIKEAQFKEDEGDDEEMDELNSLSF